MIPSSSELLFQRRLQQRDPEALAEFFDTWFPLLHAYVRRHVPNEHTAEDLTQDVFFNIHRAIETYDPERSLEPWVYRIAANKIRDHWRSSHRRHFNPVDEENVSLVETLAESSSLPDEHLMRGEAASVLQSAIDRLPESLRRTVLMRVYEDASFEAIGEAVGRNATAVRKRYSRAICALREVLESKQLEFGEIT